MEFLNNLQSLALIKKSDLLNVNNSFLPFYSIISIGALSIFSGIQLLAVRELIQV